MARIEKGSRIKFLPPKVQLLQRDQFRTITPGGMIGSASFAFDDTKVEKINAAGTLNLPSGLPPSSRYFNSNISTSINAPGVVVGNVIEPFLVPSELELGYRPFQEAFLPELNNNDSSFYAAGSAVADVGEGFNQPLRSKTKIVFDITPSEDHSFGIVNNTGGSENYPMAYWNKDTKRYQGVGGTEFSKITLQNTGSDGLKSFLTNVAIGFGASLDNGGIPQGIVSASYLVANPISNFGFPSSKMFETNPSNINPISMKDYISEPFLVEKMVLYFSGALNLHNYSPSTTIGSIATFFVLNQRKTFINSFNRTVPFHSSSNSAVLLNLDIKEENIVTTRDLVTWVQLSRIANSGYQDYDQGLKREYNFPYHPLVNVPPYTQFSDQVIVSGTIKNPLSYPPGQTAIIRNDTLLTTTCEFMESFDVVGRNSFGEGGRSFLNTLEMPEEFAKVNFFTQIPPGSNFSSVAVNKKYSKPNPYLLLPTDSLIFGWQVPHAKVPFNLNAVGGRTYDGIGPHLTASASGIHKVVFYGSLLRDNKEYHTSFETAMETDIFSTQLGG